MDQAQDRSAPTSGDLEGAVPPVPSFARSKVVVEPPGKGVGYWAGAPSAALGDDGAVYLAYRLRRPVGEGRGYANVIARSADHETFEIIASLDRERFDCASLERPALIALPGGGWRLYVSCATPGSKHWRVEVLEAPRPDGFDPAKRRTVLPGDADEGLKDPVVVFGGSRWHMWVCSHPLDLAGEEDRMTTRYAVSPDGLAWSLRGTALAPRRGTWDARGTRVTSVSLRGDRVYAYYDGRASADANAEELTGTAAGTIAGRLEAGRGPFVGALAGSRSLRYMSVLAGPSGHRLYYETTRRDGAHDLRTEYVPRPLVASQSWKD